MIVPATLLVALLGAVQATDSTLLERILAAEDARAAGGTAPMLEGARSRDPRIRSVALRAIGRLQHADLFAPLVAALDDGSPALRAEAANALAQSVQGIPRGPAAPDSARAAVDRAQRALIARLNRERDRAVAGAFARALGRLPYADSGAARAAERAMLEHAGFPDANVMHGLYALARSRRSTGDLGSRAVALMRNTARTGKDVTARRVALMGLAAAGAIDSVTARVASRDPDPQVRRLALTGAAMLPLEARTAFARRALADTSALVRLDAVRVMRGASSDCTPVIAATRDRNAHVALAAIDALAVPCADSAAANGVLRVIAGALPRSDPPRAAGRPGWQAGAHAWVALARTDSAFVSAGLAGLAAHERWQVRAYAARAAALTGGSAALRGLAADGDHNVREAAIAGLSVVEKHTGDSVYIAGLASPGYQVVLAAAGALAGSSHPGAVPALLDALDRLTRERRENSRDPRAAILSRLAELGHATDAPRLMAYAGDFDSAIAAPAAATLTEWTGTTVRANPSPLAAGAEPLGRTFAARGTRLKVTMTASSGGGSWIVRLYPDEAPATVARILRLVRAHYYDGLTFHRVVPNFVIQGGSPDATEYYGDAAFMRDELGTRSHRRGTLGISTRGRDTGDAQWFVNLVDNIRLDHDYTVFGEIVTGMKVVDGILEGDAIARVEILGGD